MQNVARKRIAEEDPVALIAILRELVAALDRRVPQIERAGERRIALESAELKAMALERIAQLEETSVNRV